MRILVRPAAAADVAGIFRVRTSVHENALTEAGLAHIGITADSVRQMILASPCAWVAMDDGRIVGFSMIDPEEGSLFAAFVLPSHGGRGIGRMLVAEAEQALFLHHRTAWLVTAGASRAAGFYRHLGWGNEKSVGDGDIRLEKQRD